MKNEDLDFYLQKINEIKKVDFTWRQKGREYFIVKSGDTNCVRFSFSSLAEIRGFLFGYYCALL